MIEDLSQRFATQAQIDQYLNASGISKEDYEEIKREAAREQLRLDDRIREYRQATAQASNSKTINK